MGNPLGGSDETDSGPESSARARKDHLSTILRGQPAPTSTEIPKRWKGRAGRSGKTVTDGDFQHPDSLLLHPRSQMRLKALVSSVPTQQLPTADEPQCQQQLCGALPL
ncbi:hypothetical protein CapIbe_001037 [Capra ibex]